MLSNTYHLAARPGIDVIERAGGLSNYMKWPHGLLTDSGGFQMVSLSSLVEISEEGVNFASPYEEEKILNLPPEESIRVQQGLGSNIMMQLDDVVSATANDDKRYEEAMNRSIRWLDRCLESNKHLREVQALFPIIQGGLNRDLRKQSVQQVVARDTFGIAIGGLSGGEAKEQFVETVAISTEDLPSNKPRYLMGVGFAVDLLLCAALGCDMFDCVYPTRTARFGTALIGYGKLISFKKADMKHDSSVVDPNCDCSTCSAGYSRAYIHMLFQEKNDVGCHLLSVHNIRFQMRFMSGIRETIKNRTFVDHMYKVLDFHFGTKEKYPLFVTKTLDILKI
jgi:queuine tRNA-ribosyltransferase